MVGAMCGALGVYIVLQGMSYIGHGLAHAVFGGAVVAFMARWNFYLGAGIWGVLSALWINSLARRPEIKADAAIGIITTASFALGVALISRVRSYTPSVEAMLFGNILGVDRADLLVVAAVLVVSTILLLVYYRPLLFHTFDNADLRSADHAGHDRAHADGQLRPYDGTLDPAGFCVSRAGHLRQLLLGHCFRSIDHPSPNGSLFDCIGLDKPATSQAAYRTLRANR